MRRGDPLLLQAQAAANFSPMSGSAAASRRTGHRLRRREPPGRPPSAAPPSPNHSLLHHGLPRAAETPRSYCAAAAAADGG